MARGKKPIDPALIADTDLMKLRDQVQSVADGAPSVLNIIQFARLNEGLVAQYRERIPVKKRARIDKSVTLTMEHAISLSGILKGELLTLLRMYEKNFVTKQNANRHLAEIDFVERHYTQIAARQVLGMIDLVREAVSDTARPGRPPAHSTEMHEQDLTLIMAAVKRLSPDRNNQEAHIEEIRQVVAEAVKAGRLDLRGATLKDSIDTHAKRLQSKARRLGGTTSH